MFLHVWKMKIKCLFSQDPELLHELGAWYGSGEIKCKSKLSAQLKAFRYYQRAANMGHAESQYDLGFMYWTGDIGEKDQDKALQWLKKAADQGYEPAIDFLRAL